MYRLVQLITFQISNHSRWLKATILDRAADTEQFQYSRKQLWSLELSNMGEAERERWRQRKRQGYVILKAGGKTP